MPLGLQITSIIAAATFLITVVGLIAKISRDLGRLDSLREDFNQHRNENREDFRKVDARFDRLESKIDGLTQTVATLVGQQSVQAEE